MNRLIRVLQKLISPLVPISDPDQYQQSRILASISLAVLLMAIVGIFLSSPSYSSSQDLSMAPVVAAFIFFLIPYYQSRSGHLKVAATTIALVAFFLIFASALSLGGDDGKDVLNFNVLILLFSLVFLSRNYTIFFVCLDFALILLYGILTPNSPMIVVIRGPLVFNLISTFFIILLTTLWRRRENEERQYLQASEQQKAQLLLKREQYKLLAQFVEALSHDLRTRLSLIETNRFLVKRLLETGYNPEQTDKRLGNIQTIVEDIDQQINNLNVVVNLGNSSTERLDLNHIVNQVCSNQQSASEKLGIPLIAHTSPLPINVQSNAEHLEIALSHLIQNALTHSSQGNAVTLTVKQMDTYGCVEVQDTGIGISSEHLTSIFDIFYKPDAARTTTHAGLGLGLTIVKLIAETYFGKIEVESKEGQGSTFRISLPLEPYPTHSSLKNIKNISPMMLVAGIPTR